MNATITQNRPNRKLAHADPTKGQAAKPATPTTPNIESIVQEICLDASHDSLKFVLRSDTGHDGE